MTRTMPPPVAPTLVPVTAVVEQARLHPAQALPPLTHQSFPFPIRGGRRGLQLLFFFGRGEITERTEGFKLWPPNYVAHLSAFDAKFEELRAVTPGDFGQRHP